MGRRRGPSFCRPTNPLHSDSRVATMADPEVVVLGAGFAGVGALQSLRKAPVLATVVDRNDYHAFLPLIYQVATNQLGPDHISSPVESLIPESDSFSFRQGQVQSIDLSHKQVELEDGMLFSYDYLLIGLGARVNFFSVRGANDHSFPLYTL